VKPPIFVVGAARSGTGLLRNLLRGHPDISIPAESHFIPHFYLAYGDPNDEVAARKLARRILRFSRVDSWDLDVDESDFADCRTYAAIVDRLFRLWAESEGKTRWGDKTPHYVSHIPTLVELFPSAKFLHIIRDGRAVSASWVRSAFGPGNFYSAGEQWKRRIEDGRRAARALPPENYLEVHYEALLKDTDATMRAVFAFLDETPPAHTSVLNPPALQLEDPRWRGVSHTEVVASNAEAWRNKLSKEGQRAVESAAGDLLEELGYPVDEPMREPPLWKRRAWGIHDRMVHYWQLLCRPRRLLDNFKLLVAELAASRRTTQ
jgi:hypothetical protein